jgi:hypothetical protein
MPDAEGPTLHQRRFDDVRAVLRRHIGVLVMVRTSRWVGDLRRGVEKIAGQHEGVIPIVDPNDTMPRRVTGCVEQVQVQARVVVTPIEVEEPSILDRRHRESSCEVVW